MKSLKGEITVLFQENIYKHRQMIARFESRAVLKAKTDLGVKQSDFGVVLQQHDVINAIAFHLLNMLRSGSYPRFFPPTPVAPSGVSMVQCSRKKAMAGFSGFALKSPQRKTGFSD